MSSLIHKPADLKSLHVRASPRSSRCPTVVWDENENQVENIPTEDAAEGNVVENDWKGGAVKGLRDSSSIQDGRCEDGTSDGVCVGWLGGIDTEEGDGNGDGDEISLESDGYGGEGGELHEESKEEYRVTGRERSTPTQLNAAATAAIRTVNNFDRFKGKDLTTGIEVERGRVQVTQGQWSGTGTTTASVSREVKYGFATRASDVDGGVSGKGSAPKLTVIHQWSSLPDIWAMDSGFEESPRTNNGLNCRKIGEESNLNSIGNCQSLNPVDHSGLEEGGDNRDTVRTIVSDNGLCSNSNKDDKPMEMVNTAETAEQKGQNTAAGTEGGTEGEVSVGGIVTAPGGESRGRASTVFLSLWDIAAYGTGALGARLEDIERYGLRSRGYLDDESETEEEDSDLDGTSWADTDESGAGINMLDMFKSTFFSGGYTAVVRAADLIKTRAQTALSFPGRISLPSIYSRPAGRKASPTPSPGASSTPHLSRGEGVGSNDMIADQLRGNGRQTHYESSASFSTSIPTSSLDGTMDRRNQTKVIAKTRDTNVNTDRGTDAGSCTFLSRLMAVKKDFFKKSPHQSDGHNTRSPGLFPLLGVGRDADYTFDEGGSVRGSTPTGRSVLNKTAHESHLHPAQLLTVDLDSTGINGKHPVNTFPTGMTQLYPSLSNTQHFSSSTLDIDIDQSRSRSTTLYARSEAENESIFSSDSFLPPATLPYGLLSLGTSRVPIVMYRHLIQ